MHWRWQEDKTPGTPWDNMAQDEALLEELQHDASALPVVRLYCWDRPSVSIGRLQQAEAVQDMFPGLPAVRRLTGGRAVLHGSDLTISVIARDADLPVTSAGGVLSSYRQIVGGVVEAFRQLGVRASLGDPGRAGHRTETVDCFALAARCDLVEEESGRKLVGSAQRRQDGFVLQQMSIPLVGVPDEAAFRHAVRRGFERNLAVTGWVSVDRPASV